MYSNILDTHSVSGVASFPPHQIIQFKPALSARSLAIPESLSPHSYALLLVYITGRNIRRYISSVVSLLLRGVTANGRGLVLRSLIHPSLSDGHVASLNLSESSDWTRLSSRRTDAGKGTNTRDCGMSHKMIFVLIVKRDRHSLNAVLRRLTESKTAMVVSQMRLPVEANEGDKVDTVDGVFKLIDASSEAVGSRDRV